MSNSNNIATLRDHLFDTLAGLRDKNNPMDIDRARAVCQVAKEITDTAKVEIDYQRVTGNATASGFLDVAPLAIPDARTTPQIASGKTSVSAIASGIKEVREYPGGTVTTHRMK